MLRETRRVSKYSAFSRMREKQIKKEKERESSEKISSTLLFSVDRM